MFDATNGKKVFELLYEKVIEHNDPQLWYEDGYCIWKCWEYAAQNAMAPLVDGNCISDEDETDLMAYIVERNPDNVSGAFDDGFWYLLGEMMENEYEMGE